MEIEVGDYNCSNCPHVACELCEITWTDKITMPELKAIKRKCEELGWI